MSVVSEVEEAEEILNARHAQNLLRESAHAK
jgi:hypothetical protein